MSLPLAILGEVEDNPIVATLEETESRLTRLLGDLNREFAEALTAPLTPAGGLPEFSGALRDPAAAYPLARRLAEEFHPLPVRVAVAAPEFPPSLAARRSEDPALDAAGELLYRARKEDRLLMVRSGDPALDLLANALTLVLYRELQAWTDRQCRVVRLYRIHRRQRMVAEALGVTQQSVSGTLSSVHWKVLEEAEKSLGSVFTTRLPYPP